MCGVCGKRFGQATNLERHSRKHQCSAGAAMSGGGESPLQLLQLASGTTTVTVPVLPAKEGAGGSGAFGESNGYIEHTPESEWAELEDGGSDEELDVSSADSYNGADTDIPRERDSICSAEDEV